MDFPRPNPDTGFGVHDSASCYWEPHGQHYSYSRMLREHGITWYLMWVYDENKADYAKALIDNGIMPIVRFGPAKMPRPGIDMAVVEAYLNVGVKWVMLGNEFNLHEEWDSENNWKGIDRPIRRVADWYVRMADEIRARGGWPLTPPPALGGHWLHRDWFIRFMTALSNIAKEQSRSLRSLLYPGGIGIHCRSSGNPLEDGPADYDCSAREFEWFNAKVVEFVGEELPMANGEWGDEPGWCRRINPQFDNRQKWDWWHNRNIQQIRWCDPSNQGFRYPENVFANCFWVVHDGGTWDDCGLLNNRTFLREMGGSDTTPLWEWLATGIDWDHDLPDPEPEPDPKPKPEPQPQDEIEFVGLSEDMIEQLVVTGPDDPTAPYWQVARIEIQPGTDNQSAFAIADMQKRFTASFFWPGEEKLEDSKDDVYAPVGANVNAASFPMFNSWGAYGVELIGNSEAVFGFGLYGDLPNLDPTHTAHHPTLVYFRLVQPDQPPDPEPEPEPEPDPDIGYSLKARLDQAPHSFEDVRQAVSEVPGVDMDWVKAESLAAERIDENDAPLFGNLREIVIHHLGAPYYDWEGLVRQAIAEGEAIVEYHFLVEKSGRILFLVPVKFLTHHSGGRHNKYSISICFEDGANEDQMEAGRFLIASLYEFFGAEGWGSFRLTGLMPHSTFTYVTDGGEPWHTQCPGAAWPKILWSGPFPKLGAP